MKLIRPYAIPHEGILKMIDQLYGTAFQSKRMDVLRDWKRRIKSDLFDLENEGLEEVE